MPYDILRHSSLEFFTVFSKHCINRTFILRVTFCFLFNDPVGDDTIV